MADLKAAVQIGSLTSGHLDHIPQEFVGQLAPNLLEHQVRVNKHPIVAAYYSARP